MSAKIRKLRHLPDTLFDDHDKVDLALWKGTLTALQDQMKTTQQQQQQTVSSLFLATPAVVEQHIKSIDLFVGSNFDDEAADGGGTPDDRRELDENDILHFLLDLLQYSPQYRIQSIALSALHSNNNNNSNNNNKQHVKLSWSASTQRVMRLALECAELRRKDCLGMMLPSSVIAAAAATATATATQQQPQQDSGAMSATPSQQAFLTPVASVTFDSATGEPVVLFQRPQSAGASRTPSASFAPRKLRAGEETAILAHDEANTPERLEAVFSRFDLFYDLLRDTVPKKTTTTTAAGTGNDDGPAATSGASQWGSASEGAHEDKSRLSLRNLSRNDAASDAFFEDSDEDAVAAGEDEGQSNAATAGADNNDDKQGRCAARAASAVQLAMNDPNPAVADLLVRILRHCSAAALTVADMPDIVALRFNNFSALPSVALTPAGQKAPTLQQLLLLCPLQSLRSLSLAGTCLIATNQGNNHSAINLVWSRFLQPSRALLLTKLDLRQCFLPADNAADCGAEKSADAAISQLCRCLEQDNYVLRSLDVRHNGLSEAATLAVVKAALIHPNLQQLLVFAGNCCCVPNNNNNNNNNNSNSSNLRMMPAVIERFFGGAIAAADSKKTAVAARPLDPLVAETEEEKRRQEVCLHVSKSVRKQLRRCLLDDPLRCDWSLSAMVSEVAANNNNNNNNKNNQQREESKKNAKTRNSRRSARTCVGLLCLAVTQALQARMRKVEGFLLAEKQQQNQHQQQQQRVLHQMREWKAEKLRMQQELFSSLSSASFSTAAAGPDQQQQQQQPHLSVELKGDVFAWRDAVELMQFLSDATDALLDAEDDILRRHNPLYQQRSSLVAVPLAAPLSHHQQQQAPGDRRSPSPDMNAVSGRLSPSSAAMAAGATGSDVPLVIGAIRLSFDGFATEAAVTTSSSHDDNSSNKNNNNNSSRDFDLLASLVGLMTKGGSNSSIIGGPVAATPSRINSTSFSSATATNFGGGGCRGSSFANAIETLHLGTVLWGSVFSDSFEQIDGEDEEEQQHKDDQQQQKAEKGQPQDISTRTEREELALREEKRQARRKQPVLLPYLDEQVWRLLRLCPHLLQLDFFPLCPPQHQLSLLNKQQQQLQRRKNQRRAACTGADNAIVSAAAVEALSFDVMEQSHMASGNHGATVVAATMPSRSTGPGAKNKKRNNDNNNKNNNKNSDNDGDEGDDDDEVKRTHGPESGRPEDLGHASSASVNSAAAKHSIVIDAEHVNNIPSPVKNKTTQQQQQQQRRRRSIVDVNVLTRNNNQLLNNNPLMRDGGTFLTGNKSLHPSQSRRSASAASFLVSADDGDVDENGDSGGGGNDGSEDRVGALTAFFAASGVPAAPIDRGETMSSMLLGGDGYSSQQSNNNNNNTNNDNSGGCGFNNRNDDQYEKRRALLTQQFYNFGCRALHLRKLQHTILAVLLSKQSNHALHRRIVEIVCEGARERAQELVVEHHPASPSFFSARAASGGSADSSSSSASNAAAAAAAAVSSPRRPTSSSGIRAAAAALAQRDDSNLLPLQQQQQLLHQLQGGDSVYDGRVRLLNDSSLMALVHLVYGASLFSTIRSVTLKLPAPPSSSTPSTVAPSLSWGAINHLLRCLGECTHLHCLDVSAAARLAPQHTWARGLLESSVAFFESSERRNTNTVTMKPFRVVIKPAHGAETATGSEGGTNATPTKTTSLEQQQQQQKSSYVFHRDLQQRVHSAELLRYGTSMYRALLPLVECDAGVDQIIRGNEGTSPPRREGAGGRGGGVVNDPRSIATTTTTTIAAAAATTRCFAPPPNAHGLLRQGELEQLLFEKWSTRATTQWTSFGLPHCAIGSAGAAAVCRFLKSGAESCPALRIRRLDLKNNAIDIDEVCAARLLEVVQALRMTQVDLRENNMTEQGLAVFHKAIVSERSAGSSLRSLSLPSISSSSSSTPSAAAMREAIDRTLLLNQHSVMQNRIVNAASGRSVVLDFTAECSDAIFDAAVRELAFQLDRRHVSHWLLLSDENNNISSNEKHAKQTQPSTTAAAPQFRLDRVNVRSCHLTEKSLPLLVALSVHAAVADWSLNRFSPPSSAVDAAALLIRQKTRMSSLAPLSPSPSSSSASSMLINISGATSDRTVPQKAGALLAALAATEGQCKLVADGWCWDDETASQMKEYEAIAKDIVPASASSTTSHDSISIDGRSSSLTVRTQLTSDILKQVAKTIVLTKQQQQQLKKIAFCGGAAEGAVAPEAWAEFFSALAQHGSASLQSLIAADCGMTYECGFKQLMQQYLGASDKKIGLSYLDISQNSAIGVADDATALLLETLLVHSQSLRFIDISGCGFSPDVAELAMLRLVAQWNALGSHAKRDLAWIEQELIVSSVAATKQQQQQQQKSVPSPAKWFANLFPANLQSHFATAEETKQQPSPQQQKRRAGAPVFEVSANNDNNNNTTNSSSNTTGSSLYTICWSHGVGSDAAVAALCESVRHAVVHAAASSVLSSSTTTGAKQAVNFLGKPPGPFPFAALDLSFCPRVTSIALQQVHQLVVDIAATTKLNQQGALVMMSSASANASSVPHLGGGSSVESAAAPSAPSPSAIELAAAVHASSFAGQHPHSARSPDQIMQGHYGSGGGGGGGGTATVAAAGSSSLQQQRPSSASAAEGGTSPKAVHHQNLHLLQSPRLQHQPQSQKLQIPPQRRLHPQQLFPLFRHVAVDHCSGVQDFSPLTRMCLDNRGVTASCAMGTAGARESPSRHHINTSINSNNERDLTAEELDFVSRCNLQPPAMRSLLLALRSASATAQSIVYFPMCTSSMSSSQRSAAALGLSFNTNSNNNSNAFIMSQSNNDSSAAALVGGGSSSSSADPITDEACFLLQKVWHDSSAAAAAVSASLLLSPSTLRSPLVVVHVKLPRNDITATGCAALADGLCGLPPRLVSLDLSENEIGDAAASKIAALMMHQRGCLKTVCLARNAFTDRGANVFVGCIEEMRSMSLPHHNQHKQQLPQQQQVATALESFDLSGCPGVSENAVQTVQIAACIPHSGTFGDLCARVLEGAQSISAADFRTPSKPSELPLLLCVGVLSHGALLDLKALDFSNMPVRDEDLGWLSSSAAAGRRDGLADEDDGPDDDDEEYAYGLSTASALRVGGVTPSGQFRDVAPERVPMLFSTLLHKLLVSAPRLSLLDISHSKLTVHAAARLFSEVAPFVREARLGHIGAFATASPRNSNSPPATLVRPSSGSMTGRPSPSRSPEQASAQPPFVFGQDETEFLAAVCHKAYMASNVARIVIGPCSEAACKAALQPYPADLEVFTSLVIRGKFLLL